MKSTHLHLLLVLGLAACGSAPAIPTERAPEPTVRQSLPQTPPNNETAVNTPPAPSGGRELFAANCQRCHGDGYAPVLSQSALSRSEMRSKVRQPGSYSMPAFSVDVISDADLEELLDHVLEQQNAHI